MSWKMELRVGAFFWLPMKKRARVVLDSLPRLGHALCNRSATTLGKLDQPHVQLGLTFSRPEGGASAGLSKK
jgi:hypothetical protein